MLMSATFTKTEGIFLAIIIICILLSAFFSMSETVFSSVNIAKLKTAVEDRKSGSKKALYLTENFDKTLTTLLVGNNIVNTLMTVISVPLFASFIKNDNYVSLVSTIVMTVVLLICGEITPKTIGKKYCDSICYKISDMVYLFTIVLFPIVILFRGLQRLISGSKESTADEISEDELNTILDTMEDEGNIETDEHEIIKNVFDLNDRTAEDIMVHRMDVTAIDVSSNVEDIKKLLLESQFSRIPVFEGDKDHIIGILYEREFLCEYIKNQKVNIRKLMRAPKFVSKAMHVDDLIKEMQKSKTHIAIVLGEYGDTLGIVTMEDALEEIVGEIYDEYDEVEPDHAKLTKLTDNSYEADGEIYVDDLFEELEIGAAPDDTTKTLSAWLFEQFEIIPNVGDTKVIPVSFTKLNEDTGDYEDFNKNVIFEVTETDEVRITKVKITIEDRREEEDNDIYE